MKALAIGGSQRENSNTEFYLTVALDVLKEKNIDTELILLRNKTIWPCEADYQCWATKSGECELRGDDFHEIYEKMVEADAIIVGSPVNYSAPHPTLWSLLVRAGFPNMSGFPNYGPGVFSRKVGGPITVARRAGQNFAFAQLLLWFFINDFIIPGSIYWNVGVARSIGDAQKDEEGIRIIKHFAENIAWLLEKTHNNNIY